MDNKTRLIDRIIATFQYNKGKSSFYCFTKEVIPDIIERVVFNFRNKQGNDVPILIIVDSFNTRQSIIYHFNRKEINKDNIKILSTDYVKLQYHYPYKLIITIGINNDIDLLQHLYNESSFMMTIITKNLMNTDFITKVRAILPNIETQEFDSKLKMDNVYTPVEERRIGVSLSEDDRITYDKYTEYINTSISVFGDLSNIEKCKSGDIKLNISSAEFRNTLAKENGWREDLDTTIPFMKEIDEIYNPNILYERACNFYTISKQRRDLVSDNDLKLDYIYNIVANNKDKKILIVSKRGEYAAKVTKFLKDKGIACGDYHDCIDDCFATDENGIPILVKSGERKGQPRIVGYQAQSTSNEKRFNLGNINVLSIKNSSSNKLKIACDIVIFTSSMCSNIFDIRKRFTNIKFLNECTITYKIYTKATIESEKLNNAANNNLINVIEENENFIGFDEKLGCIIL